MTKTAFETEYDKLNKAQKEAVDAIEGPVMVVAGPGTGKTKVLTLRMANILAKTDTEPESVLALTYTNNAAAEMRRRLAELIGPPAYRMTITTFHGLCEQVIRDYEERFPQFAGKRIADAADRRRIMEELFSRVPYLKLLAGYDDDPYYVGPALRAIEALKREGVGPDRLIALNDAERAVIMDDPDAISTRGKTKGQMKAAYKQKLERLDRLDELARLYRDYDEALASAKRYDFSDLLTRVRDALEVDEQLRLSLQERYQYLLVDEHQDTNATQNRIVELLAGFFERPNLFIVGDEKQAIYRFQGASLENFTYFRDAFKDVRLIVLNENYRSTQLLLDSAHGIRASQDRLQARGESGAEPVGLYAASDADAQYFAVGSMIAERCAAGEQADRIAVLYRNNTDGQALAEMLARMDIPYSLEAKTDVLSDPDIGRLLVLMDAIHDYSKAGPLYEALLVPWLGIPPLDVYKLRSYCGRDRNPYSVIASLSLMKEAGIASREELRALAERLSAWHVMAKQERPSAALEAIVDGSGCLNALLTQPEPSGKLARLHTIYDIARNLVHGHRGATLMDVIVQLRYVRDKGVRLEVPGPRMPGRVRLMTAHAAKGLEFDTVFLVDCYENHWPARRRASSLELPQSVYRIAGTADAQELEPDAQERNLFFVALTRARKRAVICWPQRDGQGAELQPTRYLEDIKPEYTAVLDTAPYEESYVRDGHVRLRPAGAKTPELADKDYLRGMFIRHGFSATALNNYLACPWQFFYRNLVRIPEDMNVYLMYGNAIDRALERFFERRSAGERVGKRDLLELARQSINDQPFAKTALRNFSERGRESLSGWYDAWSDQWPARSDQQVRIAGIAIPGVTEITVNGKIDKMEHLDASGTVRVVDFKTGKPKSRNDILGKTKNSNGDYHRQLTFYRMLTDRYHDGRYRMKEGVLDFIDPDQNGKYRQEAFVISSEDADALMEQVASVTRDILDLKFWDARCGQRDCTYCKRRELLRI